MQEITPKFVFETEMESMKETIQKLEQVLEDTETALKANKILYEGLAQNLAALPEQLNLDIIEAE